MTAAVVVPAFDAEHPATFSRTLLRDVLRGELGFTGTIVTDALDMAGASATTGIPEAAVRALEAGCDLLCLGAATDAEQLAAIVEAVETAVASGRLPLERLQEASDSVERLQSRPREGIAAEAPVEVPVVDAFELSDAARAWLATEGPVAVVQVETGSNLAVGTVPWGPASIGLASSAQEAASASRIAVVGRNLGAGHPAWAVAQQHRDAGRAVVVVECGWPRGGADIVTWGASPAVMRGLARLLAGVGAG